MPPYESINLHPSSHSPSVLKSSSWDVICIGSGWAGRVIAARVVQAGHTAVVIEDELVGGDCPFWACIPSKCLLRPQEALDELRGVPSLRDRADAPLDVEAVFRTRDALTRMWDDVAHTVPMVEGAGVHIARGVGRLSGERTVVVDGPGGQSITLKAEHAVVISTGSEPIIPKIPGLAEALPWTPRHATSSSTVPPRLVVLGAGAVGCEMVTAYMSYGSKVTLVTTTDEILPRVDAAAAKLVREAFVARGATVYTSTTVVKVLREGGSVKVDLSDGNTIEADEILVATGRRPKTSGLGLEQLGVSTTDAGYIPVDRSLLVDSVPGGWLYAAGDINGRHTLTHGSKYHGRVVAHGILAKISGKALSPDKWALTSSVADEVGPPQVIFTNPVVAAVGLSKDAAKAAGLDVRVVTAAVKTLGAIVRDLNTDDGWAQWVVENLSNRLVGATFVGKGVEELIHPSTVAIVGEIPLDRLAHAVPCFPTMSEIYLNLLEAAGF